MRHFPLPSLLKVTVMNAENMQYTLDSLPSQGKQSLRDLCRTFGIKYGKLDNAGMREALATRIASELAAFPSSSAAAEHRDTATAANGNTCTSDSDSDSDSGTATVAQSDDDDEEEEATFPTVGGGTLSSLLGFTGQVQPDPKNVTRVVDGKRVEPGKTDAEKGDANGNARHHASGYKIDPVRPEQNGVKRPSAGTLCGAVWEYLDANPVSTAKEMVAVAADRNWNRTNVLCELYNWRKFNGLTRATKGAAK